MKTFIVLLIAFCFTTLYTSKACTTFFIKSNDQIVFGRNYDWSTGAGTINTNLKGLFKTSAIPSDKPFTWVSKYGSITFNQFGKEFPNGGMNEKGLVVELMWLTETKYPSKDSRNDIDNLQWIQYQLDNYSTVEEVIASDKMLRISSSVPLHYLIADANGNVATIEFLKGKMVVHQNSDLPFPVLTNSTYTESAKAYQQNKNTDNSLQRFSTACNMIDTYQKTATKKPIVDFAFEILNKVSQGSFTKWSIVYDIKNKQIHFKTDSHQQQKIMVFEGVDFSCNNKALAFDMNQNITGKINTIMKPYSDKLNKKIVDEAVIWSRTSVAITDEEVAMTLAYPATIKCKTDEY